MSMLELILAMSLRELRKSAGECTTDICDQVSKAGVVELTVDHGRLIYRSITLERAARSFASNGFDEHSDYSPDPSDQANGLTHGALPRSRARRRRRESPRPSRGPRLPPPSSFQSPMAAISPKERVLALLRRPEGVSIAEIAKATGWKRSTVRGFFSTVVRGELRCSLASHEVDGVRIYRLVDTQR